MFDVGDSGIDTDGEEDRPQSDGSSSEDDGEPMIIPWWDQQKTVNDEPVNEAGNSDGVKEPRPEHRPWWYRPDHKINCKEMKEGQLNPIDMGNWPNTLAKQAGRQGAGQPAFPGGAPLPRVPDSPDRSSPPLYEVELTASDEDDDASVLELVIPMSSSSPKKSTGHRPRQRISRKISRNRKRPASSILSLEATVR